MDEGAFPGLQLAVNLDGRGGATAIPEDEIHGQLGKETPTWVHLEDEDGGEYTVRVPAFPGPVEILDGRVEPD